MILAINDLERGMAEFFRITGVQPVPGGAHPGRSTRNALVSLGGGAYLEILAPAASVANPDSIIPFRDLALGGWALRPASLDTALARLRAAGFEPVGPTPGSRRTPDGRLLEWRTGGARGAGLSLAPFLIEWSPRTAHPSASSPGGCRLDRLEIREPEPEALRRYLQAVGHLAGVTAGHRGMVVHLSCPKGPVSFATLE